MSLFVVTVKGASDLLGFGHRPTDSVVKRRVTPTLRIGEPNPKIREPTPDQSPLLSQRA